MSTSAGDPVAPLERKDLRSTHAPLKRNKDQKLKWSNRVRLTSGLAADFNDEVGSTSNTSTQKKQSR
ncbi:hypothetical protein IFR05_017117 [Cadophora sp. M221]|nr:hypothetical protein IFR05_017117 [Cadophora sp. M221]